MKKVLVIAMLMLLPVMAKAEMPLTIGAGSLGYGASSIDKGESFTTYWGGIRFKEFDKEKNSAVYAMYQHVAVDGGVSGDGAKLLLISGSEKIPWLKLMADVGFAFSLAENADGSTTTGLTSGGGFAVTLSEMLAPFVYASAIDTGDRFAWSIHFGFAITDLQALIGK